MLTIVITFVVVTTVYAGLFWFAFRRVAMHLRGNQEATKAVVEHVLLPLLGRNPGVPVEEVEEEETGNNESSLAQGSKE